MALRLRELTGRDLRAATVPETPQARWTAEAGPLLARYGEIRHELARRNSQRMSRQLSRFMTAANGETEMTDAMRRW